MHLEAKRGLSVLKVEVWLSQLTLFSNTSLALTLICNEGFSAVEKNTVAPVLASVESHSVFALVNVTLDFDKTTLITKSQTLPYLLLSFQNKHRCYLNISQNFEFGIK